MKDFLNKVIQTMESIIEDAKSDSYSNYRNHYKKGYRAAQAEIIAEMEKRLCYDGYDCDEKRCETVMAFIKIVKEKNPRA